MKTLLFLKRSRVTGWPQLQMMKWSSLLLLLLLLGASQEARAEQDSPGICIELYAGIDCWSKQIAAYNINNLQDEEKSRYDEMVASGCEMVSLAVFDYECGMNNFILTWDESDKEKARHSWPISNSHAFYDYPYNQFTGYADGYGLNDDIVIYVGHSSNTTRCLIGFKDAGDWEKPLYVLGDNIWRFTFSAYDENDKLIKSSDKIFIDEWWWVTDPEGHESGHENDGLSPYNYFNEYAVDKGYCPGLNGDPDQEWDGYDFYEYGIVCDPGIEMVSYKKRESNDLLYPLEVVDLPDGKKAYKIEFSLNSRCDGIIFYIKQTQQAPEYLNISKKAGVELMNGGMLIKENDEGYNWATNDPNYQTLKAAGCQYIYNFGVEPGCSDNIYSLSWDAQGDSEFYSWPGVPNLYDKDGYRLPQGQAGFPAGYTPNKDIVIYISNPLDDPLGVEMDLMDYPGIDCLVGFKKIEDTGKTLYIDGTNQRRVEFWLESTDTDDFEDHVKIMLFGEDETYCNMGYIYEGNYDYDWYYNRFGDKFWFTVECDPGYEITSMDNNLGEWGITDPSKYITEVTSDGKTIYKIQTAGHKNDMCITFTIILAYHAVSPELNFVDLGLPSGTKWCKFNIKAGAPEKAGNFYAWGEKEPKSTYTWKNYKYCSGTAATCQNIGDDISMSSDYDIAYSLYQEVGACLPTAKQWNELLSSCTWKESTQNGVKGYTVTGPNGQSIFLPFAGCSYDGKKYGVGSYAYYWTSNNVSSSVSKARGAYIKTGVKPSITNLNRRTGMAIRPVIPPESQENDIQLVDLGLSVRWASENLGAENESADCDFYAWGETEPKATYTWKNYVYANGSSTSVVYIGSDISQTEYDAATNLAESFAMPTSAQWKELIERCTWKAETVGSTKGYRVTGPSGKNIFLPFSGCSYDGKQVGKGTYAYYWSSENSPSYPSKAKAAYLKSGTTSKVTTIQRRTGAAIRAVEGANGYVNLNLPSGNLWATNNIGAGSEEQAGDYYAWGETSTKSNYTWKNYKYANGTSATVQNIGKNICGNATYDPAVGKQVEIVKGNVTYTYESQMPSYSDMQELYNICDVKEETVNGVKGLRFTRDGNSIFLPYTGSWYDGKKHDVGTSAYYWSGNVNTSNTQQARTLYIKGGNTSPEFCRRRTGLPIRPVFVIKRAYANSADFDTDGIDNTTQTFGQDDAIYNLQGIKMEGALKPGIYIQNGKKFVVK